MIASAKKERELQCLIKKQLAKTKKLNQHEHFLNHDMLFGIPGDPEFIFDIYNIFHFKLNKFMTHFFLN